MKGRGAWFVLHVFLLFATLLFMLVHLFALGGYLLWLEVLAVLGLAVIGGLAIMQYVHLGARRLLLLAYLVSLLNVLVLAALTGRLSVQALIIAFIGAVLSFPYARTEKMPAEEQFNGNNGKEVAAQEPIDADAVVPEKKTARKRRAKRKKRK